MPKGKRGRPPEDPKDVADPTHPIQQAADAIAASAPPDPVNGDEYRSTLTPDQWRELAEAHDRFERIQQDAFAARFKAAGLQKELNRAGKELAETYQRVKAGAPRLPLFDPAQRERDQQAMETAAAQPTGDLELDDEELEEPREGRELH